MQTNSQSKQTLTASQKLERLEQAMSFVDQTVYNLAKQNENLQQALQVLNNKINAMVIALSTGQNVTNAVLDQIDQDEKVKAMKQKVQDLIDKGMFVASEEAQKTSFVVVRELDLSTGTVVNPRLQFAVGAIDPSFLEKIIGKKVGDQIRLSDEDQMSMEIEEIYEIIVKGKDEEQLASSEEMNDNEDDSQSDSEEETA